MTKELTVFEDFRAQLSHPDTFRQVVNYFGGDEDLARKFASSAVYSVRKVPELLSADRGSLMQALITCAELKLFPSSASGEAYILPYKGKAQFQLGYKGIVTLAYRGGIDSIVSKIVYAGEPFEYEEGLNPRLVHKPSIDGIRGEPIGVYAIASVRGEKVFHYMTKADVMKFKEFSQSKSSDYSPWNPKRDPELWMWRKTCIKQLAKTLPQNETLAVAIEKDNEDSTIAALKEEQRRQIDATLLKEETGHLTMRGLAKNNDKKETKKGPQAELDFKPAGSDSE